MGKIDYYRNLAGFNILMVENGTFIGDTLAGVFRSLDCSVVVADSVLNGIKYLDSDSFDIIISDMALPGMDRLEFFKYFLSLCPQSLKILIVNRGDIAPLCSTLRTGVDDVRALVAVMVQSDRFGTSIVNALRTHADSLRVRRRQRAEVSGPDSAR